MYIFLHKMHKTRSPPRFHYSSDVQLYHTYSTRVVVRDSFTSKSKQKQASEIRKFEISSEISLEELLVFSINRARLTTPSLPPPPSIN